MATAVLLALISLEPVRIVLLPIGGEEWRARVLRELLTDMLEVSPSVYVSKLKREPPIPTPRRRVLIEGSIADKIVRLTIYSHEKSFRIASVLEKGGLYDSSVRCARGILSALGLPVPAELPAPPPQRAKSLELLLKARYSKKLSAEAVREAEAVLSEGGQLPFVLESAGLVLMEAGERQRAVELLQKAFNARPSSRVALLLSRMYLDRGNEPRAREVLRKAMSSGVKSVDTYLELARLLMRAGQGRSARSLYHQALERDPLSPRTYLLIADLYIEENNLTDALKHFDLASKLDPALPPAYNGMGTVYARRGKHKLAKEFFEKALSLDPHYASAYINLALCIDRLGETQEAIETLKKALTLAPGNALLHNNLGWLYQREGNYIKARQHYLLALSFDPSNRVARRNLEKLKQEQTPTSSPFGFCSSVEFPPSFPPGLYLIELELLLFLFLLRRLLSLFSTMCLPPNIDTSSTHQQGRDEKHITPASRRHTWL